MSRKGVPHVAQTFPVDEATGTGPGPAALHDRGPASVCSLARRLLAQGRHVAWTRRSVSLLLCLGACTVQRAGVGLPSEPAPQTAPASASDAGYAAPRRDAGIASGAIGGDPWLDAMPNPHLVEDAGAGAATGTDAGTDAGADAGRVPTPHDLCPGDAGDLCGCRTVKRDRDRDGVPDCMDDSLGEKPRRGR